MERFNDFKCSVLVKYEQKIKEHSLKSWDSIDKNQPEPSIIQRYLLNKNVGIDYLNENIAKPISNNSNYNIKFASVFTHQKPRVTRTENSMLACNGDTLKCELGDLLSIFCFVDKEKNIIFSSGHIVQAKKEKELSSLSQKCLYECDKEFLMPSNITKNSICENSLRIMPEIDREIAFSYLILSDIGLIKLPWDLNKESPLGFDDFIFRTMKGEIGKQFDLTNVSSNSWDCIIDDLINVGTGGVKSSKVRGDQNLRNILNIFNDFFFYDIYSQENTDYIIPILLIVVQDKESIT